MLKSTVTKGLDLIQSLRWRLFDYAETLKLTDILLPGYILFSLFTFAWFISIFMGDVTLVDFLWGLGFAVQSVCYLIRDREEKMPLEKITFNVIVIAHSLRLTFYLMARQYGQPEDKRYTYARSFFGKSFAILSYFIVFLPQLVLNLAMGSIIYEFNKADLKEMRQSYYWTGIATMLFGSLFQSLADIQLYNFRRNKRNKGFVCDKGLWSLCRHPNYFGDVVFWFGAFLCNASAAIYYTIFAPLMFTFFIFFVSGIFLLEKFLLQDKGDLYQNYKRRVSAFVPWIFNKKYIKEKDIHREESSHSTQTVTGTTDNNSQIEHNNNAEHNDRRRKKEKLWKKNSKSKNIHKKDKKIIVPKINMRKQEFYKVLQ